MIQTFEQLLKFAAGLPPKRVAVINPSNEETFDSIVEAQKALRATFLLTGDTEAIEAGLAKAHGDASTVSIRQCRDMQTALKTAINAVREREADILMKGGVDTSTMMRAVLDERDGLRTGRLLSDIFLLEFPHRQENRFVMITDGGMTLAPDLKNKVELINNAVEVAHALGNALPKVAILSATEFVLPNLQSTLDAAALAKMNDRGQITGCIVDGPFALDNAISDDAAAEKRIKSEVAGRAEILIAANIESANSLAKSTTYFAGLRLAHVVVGGRAPILIPSRADKSDAKLLSIALGMIMSEKTER
ncbi:MAG: bifunctional enoyl-CoA hydratase/phosphate acetyltransferase [Bacteroidota bacterium]